MVLVSVIRVFAVSRCSHLQFLTTLPLSPAVSFFCVFCTRAYFAASMFAAREPSIDAYFFFA